MTAQDTQQEQTKNATTPADAAKPVSDTPAQTEHEETIPASRFAGVVKQASEQKARADAALAKLAEIEAKAAAEAEAKAKANGEFEKLLSARDAELAALRTEAATVKAALRESNVRQRLVTAGLDATNELALDGALLRLRDVADDGLDEAIAAMRKSHAALFAPPTAPVRSGSVGTVDTKQKPLSERLRSTDPKVRLAAADEQLRLIATGAN